MSDMYRPESSVEAAFLRSVSRVSPICARKDCGQLAVYQPVVQLRCHLHHQPAEAMLGIGLCPSCKEQHGTVDDLVSDEGFEQFARILTGTGRAKPVRVLTTIRWQELPVEGRG